MRVILRLLGISVLILLAMGFTVLASASGENGIRLYGNAYHFLFYQGIWLGVAVVAMLFAVFFDYHRWRRHRWLTVAFYIGVCLLLAAVLLFGKEINGSKRWIDLGVGRLQPSELAKLAVIVSLGVYLDRVGCGIERLLRGALPAIGIIGVLGGLTIVEPDFGSTMVICATGFVLLFVFGMKISHMAVFGLTVGAGGLFMVARNANRMRRIVAWLPNELAMKVVSFLNLPDVAQDEKAQNAAHQLNQALIAIQRGGLTGVGFNRSMQKQYYLPEAHTDFIFAIGAEEFGLIFSLLLLAMFITFFICGIMISLRAPDRIGRLFAFGATFLIFFQVLFNIGVVTGLLPTKGLALPFISYGGTNLVSALVAVGLLFNVGRQIELQNHRQKSKISPVFSTQGG